MALQKTNKKRNTPRGRSWGGGQKEPEGGPVHLKVQTFQSENKGVIKDLNIGETD